MHGHMDRGAALHLNCPLHFNTDFCAGDYLFT